MLQLVAEFAVAASEATSPGDAAYDEKNIRRRSYAASGERPQAIPHARTHARTHRRVYDALNVLMAMEIITKEKKNIMWRGLPTNTEQEGVRLQMDLESRRDRVEKKKKYLQELLAQQISFRKLVKRNRQTGSAPESDLSSASRVPLPFIIVNSKTDTVIDCEMAQDRQEVVFNFSQPFEIQDDNAILKRMRMQKFELSEVGDLVPEALADFTRSTLQR